MTAPAMWTRRLPLILALATLPALTACSGGADAPEPLSPAALAVVDARPGAPRAPLARAIDDLFIDPAAGETRALLVYNRGRLVAERYGEGFGAQTRQLGWSMSKAVTGVMIGMLVADGRLRLDEPVPIPAWQRSGDPRGEITLRHLLQMRAGLRHAEGAAQVYDADEVRMLFLDGRDDSAAYAEAQPLGSVPGTRFNYSTANAAILSDIAARVLADSPDPARRRTAVADYLANRLFKPIGLASMVAEYDAAGTLEGGAMIHATARDWGRFGEFLRNGGSVKGAQVVPRGWIAFMTAPSPRKPGYGAQLWLNRPQAEGGRILFAGAPRDAFAAVGHLGQYVLVSPRQGVTIVRLGHSSEEARPKVRAHLAEILSLYPSR